MVFKYYNDTYQNGDHIGSLEWSEWRYNKKLHISLLHVIIAEKNWKMERYTITFSNTDHPGEGTAKSCGIK